MIDLGLAKKFEQNEMSLYKLRKEIKNNHRGVAVSKSRSSDPSQCMSSHGRQDNIVKQEQFNQDILDHPLYSPDL